VKRMSSKASLGAALAGTVALLAFVAPAANAATARASGHPSAGQTKSGTPAQGRACFKPLGDASDNMFAAAYDLLEEGPWKADYHTALTELKDPVCAPFASVIKAPIARSKSLAAKAARQVAAGHLEAASNNFQLASYALNPAWSYVFCIGAGFSVAQCLASSFPSGGA